MSFSFCLNKNQLLLLSGFGLLFQGIKLNRKSKTIQDLQRLICSVVAILERSDASNAENLKKLACTMFHIDKTSRAARLLGSEAISRRKSESTIAASQASGRSTRKQLQAIASRVSCGTSRDMKQMEKDSLRSATSGPIVVNHMLYARNDGQNSASSIVSDPTVHYGYSQPADRTTPLCQLGQLDTTNLDYLSFNHDSHTSSFTPSTIPVHQASKLDIDRLVGYVSSQHSQLSCDGHFPSAEMLSTYVSSSPSSAGYEWSSDIWAMSSDSTNNPAPTQSVLSFSEEEAGEDLNNREIGRTFRGMIMQNNDNYNGMDGYEGFGL